MAKTALKQAAITRAAFEYQDLVGIEVLINYFRDPALYHWVELESEEPSASYLDDVVAARKDGSFEYIQVKFTVDPDRFLLDWDWLLERKPRGTSRLKKWADSIFDLQRAGPLFRAELRTNRKPDLDFARALDGDRIIFGRIAAPQRHSIEKELGSARRARAFFKAFRFRHSENADVDGLEQRLKGAIVPTDTTSSGWLLLRQQVNRWATHKNQPEPDGKIRHDHLVQIVSKRRPKPIPQNFLVPDVYAVPSHVFHEGFIKRVTAGRSALSVLWGTPGRGKSTYLSFLVRELTKKKLPVVRHHYFLSLDDTTTERISFSDVTLSLMHQITSRYPEAVEQRGLEESPNQLRKWLQACGEHFGKQKKRFYVVIDGLDHVWREQMNIEQMNHLFNYLLPCPKNVVLIVGTQRVADNQLPSRLLTQASPTAWIEVPPMDERAVQDWVNGQNKAGRLRPAHWPRDKDQRKESIDAISKAFFEISMGHPLHLIYSFETLVRRGVAVTPDEVKILPRCPDGDIRKYYRNLWKRIRPQGKTVIHLVAGSEFRWPSDGLRRCAGSLDEVDHLLEHRRTGVVPFHGSILAYAREQPEHDSVFKSLLPKTVRWLEREAPQFWRWGWLWITKAKNGNKSDLLTKTTRAWVLDSLAQGWPDSQIVSILREAENAAFAQADYCRSMQLRSLKLRMQNGPEFQLQRYSEFLEVALRSSENKQQLLSMADDLGSLPDDHIIALLRSLPDDLADEIGSECEAELRRRVNLWLALRHRPAGEFLMLVRRSFEALASNEAINIKSVLKFIEGFHDRDDAFRSLLGCLVQKSRLDALVFLVGLLSSENHKRLRRWTEDALVRVAALEGADLKTRLQSHPLSASPLMCCWLLFHGEPAPTNLNFDFDTSRLVKDRYEYGPNPALQIFFHELFFSSLAICRSSAGDFSFVLPGIDEDSLGWMNGAVDALRDTARGIAENRLRANFSTPFLEMQRIAAVAGRRTIEADSTQYWAFKAALRQIAVDLHLISILSSGSALVPDDDFSAARKSRHWDDAAWLSANLSDRLALLEAKAAKRLLDSLAKQEDITVTAFNERAERWVDLGLFGLLYGLPDMPLLVKRAADCIMGYGYHKDPYIFEVLDTIDQVRQEEPAKAKRLLKTIAPIVDQIMEITDGDDIRSARNELIDLIGEMYPDKLPDCYAHHIRADRLALAEDVLEAHTKRLNFENPISRSLSKTFLERRDILILSECHTEGRPGAGDAFAEQERFVGGVAVSREHSNRSDTEDFARSGKPPDFRKFGPSQFARLVDHVSDPKFGYQHRDEALSQWLFHWKEKTKGREALKSIDDFFKKAERTYSAEHVLDDAFLVSLAVQGKKDAYRWLVRSHVVRHGWQSYWTSSKEIVRRLEWAAKYYKEKWKDFIWDTSKQEPFWERRNYGFNLGIRYLVRFLILVDQTALATKYTSMLAGVLVEEVGDQPLLEIPWLR